MPRTTCVPFCVRFGRSPAPPTLPLRATSAPDRSESEFYAGGLGVVVVVVVVVVGGTVVVVVVVVVAGATVVVAAVVVVVVPEALAVWAYAAWTPPIPKVVTTGTAKPTAAIFFKNARRSSPVDSVSCWSLIESSAPLGRDEWSVDSRAEMLPMLQRDLRNASGGASIGRGSAQRQSRPEARPWVLDGGTTRPRSRA